MRFEILLFKMLIHIMHSKGLLNKENLEIIDNIPVNYNREQVLNYIKENFPIKEETIAKYDISSEAYNLCEDCGYSWCECGNDDIRRE